MSTRKKSATREVILQEVSEVLSKLPDGFEDIEAITEGLISLGGAAAAKLENVGHTFMHRWVSTLLRSTKIDADDGDVRKFQAVKMFTQTEDGKETQKILWSDIDETNSERMMLGVRQRMQHVQEVAQQTQRDVLYWSRHVAPRLGEKEKQLYFKFTWRIDG